MIFYTPPTDEAKVYVFLCELKSGGSKKTMAQLRNGKLIAEHILSVVSLHGNVQQQPVVEFRGLILANRAPSPKGSLRPSAFIRYEVDGDTGMRFVIMRPGGTHHLRIFCS